MSITLPSKVRKAIYVLATVVSPVVAYLAVNGTITDFQSGLYSVVMTGITALAAINTNTEE